MPVSGGTGVAPSLERSMWEIAYNALANRLGVALPQTQKVMLANRPTGNDHQMEWETLTHADIGTAGGK